MRLENGDASELVELRCERLVVERAGDEHVEIGVAGFLGGLHEIRSRDGAAYSGPMKMAARRSMADAPSPSV